MLKLLSGLYLVDSEAKKACSTQADTNQRRLYAPARALHCYIIHVLCITCISHACHGNDDEMWSTSCLIMQHKPYIVELSFMETQESNDSINEGPSITMEGPSQTNAVLVPLHDVTCRNHRTEFKSDIKLYTPYPCHLSHSLALLHIL